MRNTMPRRALYKSIAIMITITTFFTASELAAQGNSDGLAQITEFTRAQCEQVAQAGSATKENVKGDFKAGLSALIKRLVDAGGNISGEVQSSEYAGVLQEDLSTALNSVRECRERLAETLIPLLIASPVAADAIIQHIQPGREPTPRTACRTIPEGGLIVIVGTNAFVATSFPHSIIRVRGRDIISILRHSDGSLGMNIDLMSADGRSIAKIIDNKITVNTNNYAVISRPKGPSSFAISSQDGTALELQFLNEQAVIVSGTLVYQSERVEIGSNGALAGNIFLTNSCFSGNKVDIDIE